VTAVRQSASSATSRAVWLRRDAEKVAGALPPLLAEAERLAAIVAMGLHGRRKAGPGETFWQYRRAVPGDTLSDVDWRRSARSDHLYIREMEWEAAQSVSIWADRARSMDYRGAAAQRTKRKDVIGSPLLLWYNSLIWPAVSNSPALSPGITISSAGCSRTPPRLGAMLPRISA